jgi:hypothetical protein
MEMQELRKLKNSTANAYGALSLGLFSVGLWTCSTRNRFGTIIFLILGIVSILTSFYLAFLPKWHRKKIIDLVSGLEIEYVNWMLGLVAFGVALILTRLNWAALLGIIFICLGLIILIFGFAYPPIKKVIKNS